MGIQHRTEWQSVTVDVLNLRWEKLLKMAAPFMIRLVVCSSLTGIRHILRKEKVLHVYLCIDNQGQGFQAQDPHCLAKRKQLHSRKTPVAFPNLQLEIKCMP